MMQTAVRWAPFVCASLLLPALGNAAENMIGFDAAGSSAELGVERQLDANIASADLRGWLKDLAAAPNNVGAPHDRRNAEKIRAMLASWGWDAHIETFQVLYPTPLAERVELVAPTQHLAQLMEPPIPGDAGSAVPGALPAYNVYGADGDVTADVVYVNFGMDADYQELARRGISVSGRIVLARYGNGWRGLKAKLAHEHGAVGCLIYSDPHEDGYAAGDAYPLGGWRPANGIQRGSVADIPVYSGDPLTPGVGATAGATRLAIKDAPSLMKIPVLPISWADAQPILAALGGPVAPPAWRGSLPLTYHLGPGAAKVHLLVKSDWGLKPIYDVIATIRGADFPDEWVIRGNHHDGWVEGAWDPLAGVVAQLAEARAIGALLKTAWRPKRTLVYASWDGEEPGLLGSTEWVETHAKELQAKAVLYLNSDENGRGFLSAGGSDSLQHLLNQVAAAVTDPETGVSVQARLRARTLANTPGGTGDADAQAAADAAGAGRDLLLKALGSGSDFTPFLQHLGIATLSVEFGGEADQSGVYHSRYDTFDHYVRFGDPDFKYGVALAQTNARMMLRVADAQLLPQQAGTVAQRIDGYVHQLHALVDARRKHAADLQSMIDARVFELASDPTRPLLAPAAEAPVPFLDFTPLDNAVTRLTSSARAFDAAYAAQLSAGVALPAERATQVNAVLRNLERALTDPRGLPGRAWYTHLIYAPGLFTGYGVKTIPGVREAIERSQWQTAEEYARRTAVALGNYSEQLDHATSLLRPD
ncbi:MAG TPA: transferrin receptor-like dimerization domain-containing protein [Steroidobacteraceae bacterium]|jgi:N-acetylated-alpha-linked acidic dipeptidase|nr:transferrin receptor-like dimerization domain-containing protein [Steroidobacteraceae bacterium]